MAAAAAITPMLLILVVAAPNPVLLTSSVTVTDPFDDITHLPFVGSLFFVDHNETLAGKSARLKFGSEQLWSGILNNTGFVEVPPTRRAKDSGAARHSPVRLGPYVLSIDGNPDILFSMPKILCSDASDLCQKKSPSCNNSRRFCTVSYSNNTSPPKNTVNFCDLPSDQDICSPSSYDIQQICTQEFTESYSICRIYKFENLIPLALVQDLEGDEDQTTTRDCTFKESNVVAFTLDNVYLEMGSYILMPANADSLVVKCARKSKLTLTVCWLVHDSKKGGAKMGTTPSCVNLTCNSSLKKLQSNGMTGQVVTLKARHGEFLSHVHLVDVPLNISVQKTGLCRAVKCGLDVKDVDPRFRIQWQVYKNGVLIISHENFRPYRKVTFAVDESGGSYRCWAKIRFRVCSPFTEYFKISESSTQNFTADDFRGQTECTTNRTTSDGGEVSSSVADGVVYETSAAENYDDYATVNVLAGDEAPTAADESGAIAAWIYVLIVFFVLCSLIGGVVIFVYFRRKYVAARDGGEKSSTASISVKSKLMAAAAAPSPPKSRDFPKSKKTSPAPPPSKKTTKVAAAPPIIKSKNAKSPTAALSLNAGGKIATKSAKKDSQKNHLTLPLLSLLDVSSSGENKTPSKTKK